MGESNARSDATLRIFSRKLSVGEISELLGTEPTAYHVMGSKAAPDHPKSYVHPRNVWLWSSGLDKSDPLEAHLEEIVEFIATHDPALKELQQSCDMDIFCGFISDAEQRSFTLRADLLKRLAQNPITIIVDL